MRTQRLNSKEVKLCINIEREYFDATQNNQSLAIQHFPKRKGYGPRGWYFVRKNNSREDFENKDDTKILITDYSISRRRINLKKIIRRYEERDLFIL